MRFWDRIGQIEGGMASVGAGICLFAMMMITVASVFGRYVLETDVIPGGYNIIERVTFPLIVFWGLPLAHREGSFPRFDMIVQSMSRSGQAIVSIIVLTVEILVYGVVLWYIGLFTWEGITSSREMQIGTDTWPLWPILVMIPLAFGLMLLEMFRLLWLSVQQLRSRSYKQSVPGQVVNTI